MVDVEALRCLTGSASTLLILILISDSFLIFPDRSSVLIHSKKFLLFLKNLLTIRL